MILALGRGGVVSCFEAWDLRPGRALWQTALPRPGARVDEAACRGTWPSAGVSHVAQASISAGARGTVWSLALDTGRLRSWPVPEGYETRRPRRAG